MNLWISIQLTILFFVLLPLCHYWVFIKDPKENEDGQSKTAKYNARNKK
jgi:hypothetical protein